MEELYIGYAYEEQDLSPLYPLKKLQRVQLGHDSNIEDLVKHLPQLKFVLTERRSNFLFGDTECSLQEIGSTIVVGDNYMKSQDVNIVRKVKDLITVHHSAYFAFNFALDPTFITFMVKELKLDINYE